MIIGIDIVDKGKSYTLESDEHGRVLEGDKDIPDAYKESLERAMDILEEAVNGMSIHNK